MNQFSDQSQARREALRELSGWGRYRHHPSKVVDLWSLAAVTPLMHCAGLIARGNGRSYGDAAIGTHLTAQCRGLNRFRSFDPASRSITVEAGVLLEDLIKVTIQHYLFPPVVPGTMQVTIGGMIASDVHGKNHHRDGGFGDHLEAITVALPGGDVLSCSRTHMPELFFATIGGMGLTGLILDATFRLRPVETGWILQQTVAAPDLASTIRALEEARKATYSVAWVDCLARGPALGRSLVYVGEHARRAEVETAGIKDSLPETRSWRPNVPFCVPDAILNRYSVALFGELYYRKGVAAAERPALIPWSRYFFPLDAVHNWNHLYGRRGFVQYQFVVPDGVADWVICEILSRLNRNRAPTFLAVLKQLRPGAGLMSFPLAGYTLAVDLPATAEVLTLLQELDALVVTAGGRLYLAKDARQSRDTFEASYPNLPAFRDFRRAVKANRTLSSFQAQRLGL